jgi:hypothetical protein
VPESEKTEAEVTAEAEATAAAEVATKEAEAQAATAKEAEDKASADATALDAEKVAAAAKDAELPEWARAELTRVRNEAAASRISLRDATAKFEGAKTPEEFAAAVAEIQAENVRLTQDLARTTVGTKYKLPPELVAVLTGDTPEALDAHAKLLSKFVTAEEVDPETLSGGLTPDGTNGAFDPVAEARKARLSRY